MTREDKIVFQLFITTPSSVPINIRLNTIRLWVLPTVFEKISFIFSSYLIVFPKCLLQAENNQQEFVFVQNVVKILHRLHRLSMQYVFQMNKATCKQHLPECYSITNYRNISVLWKQVNSILYSQPKVKINFYNHQGFFFFFGEPQIFAFDSFLKVFNTNTAMLRCLISVTPL